MGMYCKGSVLDKEVQMKYMQYDAGILQLHLTG
jgi:hypothetical protein